jgi:hypothetical protein
MKKSTYKTRDEQKRFLHYFTDDTASDVSAYFTIRKVLDIIKSNGNK